MKIQIITAALLLIGVSVLAQTPVNKSLSTAGASEIRMNFKYPELIKISTWDKNEVSVTGRASINNGLNDDAFKLGLEKDGSVINITSNIENLDKLPQKIMIKKDGMKYFFDTDNINDPKIKAFHEEHGDGNYQYQMHGVIKEIKLEIKVPKSIKLNIQSKYGLVEATNVTAAVTIDAKYGGIDISLPNASSRSLTARTKYGELYSDLDLEVDRSQSASGQYYKWTTVVAKLNGGGTDCLLESKYGNVYIRKQ